jgi:uncharacterized protein DUF4177
MAEFKYKIHRIQLQPDADFDAQLEKVLDEKGNDGWELVQIMHRDKVSEDPTYRLIFKTQKATVGW